MTTSQEQDYNSKIEHSIDMACAGSHDASRLVFEGLIDGPLFVPDRHQIQAMSDQPRYPNDLIHVLGLQDMNRVVVPIFTRASAIEEWCGLPLSFRRYEGMALFSVIPEGWWIVLNPGSDVEKDLSPWEISLLRGGYDAIPELIEELFSDTEQDSLTVTLPEEDEVRDLTKDLISFAIENPSIQQLVLLKEENAILDEQTLQKLLLGVEVSDAAKREELKEALARIADVHQIGKEPINIYIDTNMDSSVTLGLFKNFPPFYPASV